ncbi:MAG: adenylate/guanylate cyclase domain-containing protein [Acidimicrobiia bacterium]
MVASGVPNSRLDHAEAICDLALDMQQMVEERHFGGRKIAFRIGVNSGPVVAGIIGTKKFSYDLWGDSVNVASRMESSGSEGRIQITATTKDLVDERFVCEPGGVVDVKGKGQMNVWFLDGRIGLS